jgi:hypothetical protein
LEPRALSAAPALEAAATVVRVLVTRLRVSRHEWGRDSGAIGLTKVHRAARRAAEETVPGAGDWNLGL